MNIPGYSDNGLKMLYEAIRDALAHDDAIPAGRDKTYDVREFSDWRETADKIEAVLKERGVSFETITW
ncbi:MAG: hypothetical protein ACK45D_19945 [Alphaproteobacteria bacterium]|jgi:hypothetical protein